MTPGGRRMTDPIGQVAIETVQLKKLGKDVQQSAGALSQVRAEVESIALTVGDFDPVARRHGLAQACVDLQQAIVASLRHGETATAAPGHVMIEAVDAHQTADQHLATAVAAQGG
jgi:hypothetical protein